MMRDTVFRRCACCRIDHRAAGHKHFGAVKLRCILARVWCSKKKKQCHYCVILRQAYHPCAQYAATRQPAITSGRRAAKVAKDSSDEALEAAGATNVANSATARSTK